MEGASEYMAFDLIVKKETALKTLEGTEFYPRTKQCQVPELEIRLAQISARRMAEVARASHECGDINCDEEGAEVGGSVMSSAVVVLGLSFSLGI